MKVGVVLEDKKGLEGNVCAHFGQCQFFLLADIDQENKKITSTTIVPTMPGMAGADVLLSMKF